MPRIGFLGPAGTFTEEALLTQPDLGAMELVALASIAEVLAATQDGDVDLGFVPVENAIEGTVNVTLDTLAFDVDLVVQREVVLPISMNLLGLADTSLDGVKTVLSMPVATAQVRRYLHQSVPGAEIVPVNSTAEAAQLVAEGEDRGVVAVGNRLAASLYGLDVLAAEIEDHPDNATRFLVVGRGPIPAATGHDKTTIVCFQEADKPGSLLAILQEFAARALNLTKLESRPTKRSLGEYCFIIDLEGHIGDELVADCLRDLKAKVADVKFLGSYPAAGAHGATVRRDADAAWRSADLWLAGLRDRVADH